MSETFDAVIAGASFAGLAAAQRLRGRTLLLDRDPIGSGQTSACAAPVRLVEAMGAGASIQQVHDRLIIHTPGRQTVWPLPEPFCTFDYRRFCAAAFARTGAEFRQAAVLGRSGATVRTTAGDVRGRWLVDATGWRAVLAGGPRSPYVNRRWMAFGIETEVPADVAPGLHFSFLPEVADGYAWAFPCGGVARFGVLSYRGRSALRPALDAWLAPFAAQPQRIHGGFLASGLRPPVRDGVFVVGDAAGQCLPVTGEGIRTAVLAGWQAGALIQRILDGALTPAQAIDAYRRFVLRHRGQFLVLLGANIAMLAMPPRLKGLLAGILSQPGPLRAFMRQYLGVFVSDYN